MSLRVKLYFKAVPFFSSPIGGCTPLNSHFLYFLTVQIANYSKHCLATSPDNNETLEGIWGFSAMQAENVIKLSKCLNQEPYFS